jgi:L-lactate dehydrogenase complex protein LldG
MTSARAEVLARIRRALSDRPEPPPNAREYRRTLPDGTDLLALFTERATDYGATLTQVDTADLPTAVEAALRQRGARRIAVPADLPISWLAHADIETIRDDPPLALSILDDIDGVLSGAAVAIAETGTVILDAGPGQGRRALTLLPDYHLCVLGAHQIVGTVPEAVARLHPTRPQTWISGPSATSDIELNRVEGVHGPRTLHIILTS